MNSGKICISICESDLADLVSRVRSARESADLVEVRLDCLNAVPEDLSGIGINSRTIATLRPTGEGGQSRLDLSKRRDLWRRFNHECGADLEADVVEFAPPTISPKICSYHDFSGTSQDLDKVYRRLSETDGDVLKIAVSVKDAIEALEVWKLLGRANSDGRHIIPIAMGEAGKWTRILGLAHGAYLTYAALESGNETAPGQITVRDMIEVYRVKELDKQTDVYGIIAGDTNYTMSPYIHNAAFKAADINGVFVPFQVADLDAFITRMVRPETREVEFNFRGFSVTNPHKQSFIKYLDEVDEAASRIGAVNTIKVVDGKLHGYNTDWQGFLAPLKEKQRKTPDYRVAVIGAGGAARACTYALKNDGAEITVFARDAGKANSLADDFNVSAERLESGDSKAATDFRDFDIVVNTTPLGTAGDNVERSAATAEQLKGTRLVYDLVYNPVETRLMKEANRAGAQTIGGFDMLIAQAARQFEVWTGMSAPVDHMSAAAKMRLYES